MCQILQSVKNFYNKVRQILQSVTIITKCSTTHGAFKHLFYGGDQVNVYNLLSKSQHSDKIQENTDQKKLFIWTLFMQ